MTTKTSTSFEAKLAKAIYLNLTPLVVNASTHPIFSKLNLHNSKLLKKINHKAKMVYGMSYQPDTLVKASYNRGGDDNIENALLAIHELIQGDHHADHKEYIFKRLEFLTDEAINALYERNHQEWLTKIGTAIQNAKALKKKKKTVPVKLKKKKPLSKKKITSCVRPRNKKGQFIRRRR